MSIRANAKSKTVKRRYQPSTGNISMSLKLLNFHPSQPAFTCSKLTIEILEQGVKYVQS